MGHFDVQDDGEWKTPGRTYIVARYDVMQKVWETAWRVSKGNPFRYTSEGWRRSFVFSGLGGGIVCESIESFTIFKSGFFGEMLRCLEVS